MLRSRSAVSRIAIIGIIIVVLAVAAVTALIAIQTTPLTYQSPTQLPSPSPISTSTPTPSPTPVLARPVKLEIKFQDKETPWGFVLNGKQNPDITVKQGGTVEIVLINDGQISHDFTLEEFGITKAQTLVDAGKKITISLVAEKIGTFEYYCSQPGHKDLGMKGNFVVS